MVFRPCSLTNYTRYRVKVLKHRCYKNVTKTIFNRFPFKSCCVWDLNGTARGEAACSFACSFWEMLETAFAALAASCSFLQLFTAFCSFLQLFYSFLQLFVRACVAAFCSYAPPLAPRPRKHTNWTCYLRLSQVKTVSSSLEVCESLIRAMSLETVWPRYEHKT